MCSLMKANSTNCLYKYSDVLFFRAYVISRYCLANCYMHSQLDPLTCPLPGIRLYIVSSNLGDLSGTWLHRRQRN